MDAEAALAAEAVRIDLEQVQQKVLQTRYSVLK